MPTEGVANLILALAAFVLSIAVWVSSKRLSKAEYTRSLQDAWNAFNTAALASDANLLAAEALHGPNSSAPEDARRTWMAFILLNAFQATFLGLEGKLVDKPYAEKTLKDLLHPLLGDDFFYSLTQGRGYHPDFSKYCEKQHDLAMQKK
jgi:hypothetical protein